MRNIEPALQLIKEFEGISLKPYLCPAGIPTIGVGTTVYPSGAKVSLTDPSITEEMALKYLENHLKQDCFLLELAVKKHKFTLNNNQFCALLSFIYNCGIGPIVTPGRSLYEALKVRSNVRVTEALLKYSRATVHGKRVTLPGLLRRRKAEAKLYCS